MRRAGLRHLRLGEKLADHGRRSCADRSTQLAGIVLNSNSALVGLKLVLVSPMMFHPQFITNLIKLSGAEHGRICI
ncbi:protein of unknown function [Bradyrhizobium vignae]|uniref:Uncharacterized protein n=1 Tax=Bradyrhizobium vignae TaxID=1549949 RepID=A0A2U3Q9R6_9BRAD|nr:protein of unknown function [Bradyrhizobium vignae]